VEPNRLSLRERIDRFSRRVFRGPPFQGKGQPFERGRRFKLSVQRRFVVDLLHFAKQVPSIPMQRRMNIADVVGIRRAWVVRPSWTAIFTKAFAIVAAKRPEFRRVFLPVPWGHLYEHPANVASVGVEREYEGEPGVFLGQIPQPERLSLREIDERIQHFKNAPIDAVPEFGRGLRLGRRAFPFRRLTWWAGLNISGLYRAWYFGTFVVSVTANLGAASLHQLTPVTTALNTGTFAPDGGLDVRLTYDHRVMDGGTVARALADLEEVLHVEILAELLAEATD
jgi:hypothetical protein